jgi:hypothetical protein
MEEAKKKESLWQLVQQLKTQVETLNLNVNQSDSLLFQLLQQILNIDTQNQVILKQILAIISPSPATHFTATIVAEGNKLMTKKSATASADISINDNGTATITLNFLDADGVATSVPAGVTPTYGPASDAAADGTGSSFTLTPSADGLSCAVAVVQPPPQPLHTGVTFTVTVPSGLAGQTSPQSVQTDPPLDVVAGPANSFVAAVSEP